MIEKYGVDIDSDKVESRAQEMIKEGMDESAAREKAQKESESTDGKVE